MQTVAPCPSRQDLERLLQGELPFPQVEQLAQHLEKCDRCGRTAQTLTVDDTLVEVIRQQAKAQGKQPDAVLRALMERLRGLRAPAPATLIAGPTGTEPEDYDFLAPAQGPGELGRLGPYRILKVLGVGGMGVVFLAEDPQLKRKVALKAMKPALAASSNAKKRFLREAEACAAIKHDHIITVYQVGEDRGVPFLAMEFLEGTSLDDYLKQGEPGGVSPRSLPVGDILRIARETAEGLAAAHQRGLIHRDIKPANIWLEVKDEGGRMKDENKTENRPDSSFILHPSSFRVKVLDFGLARAADDQTQLTQPGAIVGTPAYMAPEQAAAQKADERADLFSLGCTLYRMCTGQMPFKGETTMAILLALASEKPRPVRELNPAIPQPLADLVMKLLAKKPEERPASARQVVQAIQAIEEQTNKLAKRSAASSWRARIAAAVILLAVLGGLGLYAWSVLRIDTGNGTLVIETDDPDVQVVIKQGGKEVEIVDTKTRKQITLKEGKYELALGGKKEGLKLETDTVTLTRGGRPIVRVWREPKADGMAAAQGASPPPLAAAPFDEKQAKEHQKRWAEHLKVPVETTNSIGMKLALVPPGRFKMGSPETEKERRGKHLAPGGRLQLAKPRLATGGRFSGDLHDLERCDGFLQLAEQEGWQVLPFAGRVRVGIRLSGRDGYALSFWRHAVFEAGELQRRGAIRGND